MFRKKRWAALMLAGTIGAATALSPITSIEAQAGHTYAQVDGAYRMLDGTEINGVVARGIDVSHWKGVIDWKAVAADDIQFTMLGTRYNGDVDPYFRANAKGAFEAGINVGAYIYSYATTPQMAIEEADFILDLIKDYPISYPVAFDAESSALGTLSPQQISEIINVFCKKIEDAGYYPMVYANDYWLANKINLSMMHYDVWVARYEVKHVFSNPAMWQATQTGSIQGVNGNVDIDFQYKDFSPLIPASRWRTIGDKTYYYQNYVMQKDSWIQDGTGWFYMGSDAQAKKGWQKLNGYSYYLDDTDGRMASGWMKQNDNWYYMGSSGAMKTGWVSVDGSSYYLNEDGIMQTGWHTAGDEDYYLTASGHMAIGWREIDGAWYYFNGNGEKQTGWMDENNQTYYLNADGKMLSGWQNLENFWYFFDGSGRRQTGWQNLNGTWYALDGSGRMQTGWMEDGGQNYYLNKDGAMLTGWQMIDNSWYFFNSAGQRQAGLITLDSVLYYLDPATGAMAVNSVITVDGMEYQSDANGVCTQVVQTAAPDENTPNGTEGQNQPSGNDNQNPQNSEPPTGSSTGGETVQQKGPGE